MNFSNYSRKLKQYIVLFKLIQTNIEHNGRNSSLVSSEYVFMYCTFVIRNILIDIIEIATGLGSAVVEHPPMVREVPGSIPGVRSYQRL